MTYMIIDNDDPNYCIELESTTRMKALNEALKKLGWTLVGYKKEDTDD